MSYFDEFEGLSLTNYGTMSEFELLIVSTLYLGGDCLYVFMCYYSNSSLISSVKRGISAIRSSLSESIMSGVLYYREVKIWGLSKFYCGITPNALALFLSYV